MTLGKTDYSLSTALCSRARRITTSRRTLLMMIALLAAATLVFSIGLRDISPTLMRLFALQSGFFTSATLGIAQQIYVISLPRRTDRRTRMEALRRALNLQWTYVDALESTAELSQQIWEWVVHVRNHEPMVFKDTPQKSSSHSRGPPFSWPNDIDRLTSSRTPIDLWSKTIWSTPAAISRAMPYLPIPCATGDYTLANFTVGLSEHLILTKGRIACWRSHLSVIHKIANNADRNLDSAYIILEDDIDMERDIERRLRVLWSSLPQGWDIVFLGHCWSDETKSTPLPLRFPRPLAISPNNVSAFPTDISINMLYPSSSPKCTHSYVLSKRGARRLLLHLRYPPFAYSRAIDQAISWLIESGRLKSYTVVPSLVIQRKEDPSDISSGTGSKWKESLMNGVLSGDTVDMLFVDPSR